MNMRLCALSATLVCIASLCSGASAADQVEMVLTELRSDRGLAGNQVCCFLLKVRNKTAYRLEKLTFTLSFSIVATPARGGTGVPFLSPDAVGSDSEANFVATWHEGGCVNAHYGVPNLSVDVCQIGAMSERSCRALVTFRSDVKWPPPAARLPSPMGKYTTSPLTDAMLQGIDCYKLLNPGARAILTVDEYHGLDETANDTYLMATHEAAYNRALAKYMHHTGKESVELTVTNGFPLMRPTPAGDDMMRTQYSINIDDPRFLVSGEYSYQITIVGNPPLQANVKRTVKAEPPRDVAGCRLSSVLVSEETTSDRVGWHEVLDYVWYPELKMRVILRYRAEINRERGGGRNIYQRFYVVKGLRLG